MDSQWMFDGTTPTNMHHFQEGFLGFESPTHNSSPAQQTDSPQNQSQGQSQGQNHQPSPAQPQQQQQQQQETAQYDYMASGHAIDMLDASLSTHGHGEHEHHEDTAMFTSKDQMQPWPAMSELQDLDMAEMDNFLPHETHEDSLVLQQNGHSHSHSHSHSIPPTPSSFEVNGFNMTHYSPALGSEPNGSIRPDVVFTPLVSPAVTPHDAMGRKHSTSGNTAFFSPLTSPALEAKSPMRNNKKPSVSDDKSKKYSKRKTPGSTPIVAPTVPGRIAKNSPVLKAKRSSSYANNLIHQQNSAASTSSTTQTQSQYSSRSAEFSRLPDSADPSSMAPPKNTSTPTNGSALRRTRTKSNASLNQPATPATLMNIKLESSTNIATSPVILPSNDNILSRRSSSSTSTILSHLNNKNGSNNQLRTIPPDTSSASRTNNDDEEDLHYKKASHKLAEQGRRNRMNQAIADLGTLIPEQLQQTVSIPSKATTVELASEYILRLENEVRSLRERLRQGGSDLVSNESISPLETTDS